MRLPNLARRLARRAYSATHHAGVRRTINGLDVRLSAHIARGVPSTVTGDLLTKWLDLCRAAHLALDVGANVGVWSALGARVMQRGGTVFAMEPAPDAYEILCDGARVHEGPGAIVPIHAAAGAAVGTLRFSLVDGPTATTNRVGGAGSIEVPARTIDSLELAPEVIKMDVEGYELAVLRGAKQTLALRAATVLLDLHWVPDYGATAGALIELAAECGYEIRSAEQMAITAEAELLRQNSVILRPAA